MNDIDTNHRVDSSAGGAPAADRTASLTDRVRSLRLPDRPPRSFNGLVLALATLCLALACSTGYFGWQVLNSAPGAADALSDAKLASQGNGAGEPQSVPNRAAANTGNVALTSKGYIIPYQQVQVSPKVGGTVMKLYIMEGKRVKKGEVLAEIEAVEYQADFDKARATVESVKRKWQELWKYREDEIRQARADLDDMRAQREQMLAEWRRSIALKNSNALSPKEYEQAESSFKSVDFRVERMKLAFDLLVKGPRDEKIASAKADVDQAEAELVRAKWKLDNCIVRAPMAGIILSKKAEEGNQVNPSAFSNGLSASLCEMADLTDMEVDLAIAERDISKVQKGQKCQVKAEAFLDRAYEGVVSRIMPTADRGKNAVPVRVKILIPREEEGQFLRPDMGAFVTFYHEKKS
ncbi:MAG: efflux RND transporter periplasmic adaptor subunit [Planctomycetes bacterium]|nr:efflux RND transporter periplasmic adaptor subunit [Planctomycetota bacterium]